MATVQSFCQNHKRIGVIPVKKWGYSSQQMLVYQRVSRSTIYPPDLREKMFNPPQKTTLRKLFCGHDLDIIFLYIPSSSFFRRGGYSGIYVYYTNVYDTYTPEVNLTWKLKMAPWKRRSLLETIIFRFYVYLRGSIFSSKFIATVRLHK